MTMPNRTTGIHAVIHTLSPSWYVIVTRADDSHVMPLDDGTEILFGRNPECTVAVDDEALSRRHAALRRSGVTVTIEDLGSRNGTLVNGTPITGIRRLTSGDIIGVGPVTAIVATSSPPRGRQVATLGELQDRLAAEVERAMRYKRPLGIAMVRFSGEANVDPAVSQLRAMDLVAEYGPDELALVLPETTRAGAELVGRRTADACGADAKFGAAAFPEDGTSAGELVSVARARLRGARGITQPVTDDPLRKLPDQLVVVDPLMERVYELAARAAATQINVVIVGETGTGKERVAEAIHRLGPRAEGPFVRVNCAALVESLVESELFGHEAGAFSGAVAMKRGLFETAARGTLFLDEIGELPPAVQPKLLRAIESRKIVRVGGTRELAIDVRLVCATNRDLEAEVERGLFRQDLLFRIAAFVIPVPPLRDRTTEIIPLAVQFAYELTTELGLPATGFTPQALDALRGAPWPGNVRELRNVVERAIALSGGARIQVEHLPDNLVRGGDANEPEIRRKVAEVERDMLRAALDAAAGNQSLAAKRLGISRFALARLLAKHRLKPR